MKTAIFFIKIICASLIALCGFVMFICELASGTASGAFWGLAIMGFGGYLVAHVLESTDFPLQLGSSKPQSPAKPTVAEAPAQKEASAQTDAE